MVCVLCTLVQSPARTESLKNFKNGLSGAALWGGFVGVALFLHPSLRNTGTLAREAQPYTARNKSASLFFLRLLAVVAPASGALAHQSYRVALPPAICDEQAPYSTGPAAASLRLHNACVCGASPAGELPLRVWDKSNTGAHTQCRTLGGRPGAWSVLERLSSPSGRRPSPPARADASAWTRSCVRTSACSASPGARLPCSTTEPHSRPVA